MDKSGVLPDLQPDASYVISTITTISWCAYLPGFPTIMVGYGSDLRGCGKIVFGAVEGDDRHAMPNMGRTAGMETVCQLDGLLQDVSKDSPLDFPASFGESAPVNRFCIRPQSTAFCRTEEIPGLDVHPLALPASHKRQDKRDEFG